MIAGGKGVYRTKSGGIHYYCPPVGWPQNRADFGGERGRGGKSVRGTGRKRVSFEFWDSAGRQNRPVP